MDTTISTLTRSPLDSLACVNERCDLYGQAGQQNLTVRKVYSKDQSRYLRCRVCRAEFSERKNTALWNTKVREAKAVSVGEHLAEGCSLKGTARLVKVDPSTVRRLNQRLGEHGEAFHDERVHDVQPEALEADERHGYARDKGTPVWEAAPRGSPMDPASKFVLSHVQGRRNEALIRRLLTDGVSRLVNRHDLVLLTDGDASYATLFPEIFGRPYRPSRNGLRGRLPKVQFRIPRRVAHVQVIKHRQGKRLVDIEIRYTHGSKKRVNQVLEQLGYTTPNTSAIERRNGTARRMSAHQVRRSLAFSRRADTKEALGWWGVTVYNWCRSHRSLRQKLAESVDKKSTSYGHLLWLGDWLIEFCLLKTSHSHLSILAGCEIISRYYPSGRWTIFAIKPLGETNWELYTFDRETKSVNLVKEGYQVEFDFLADGRFLIDYRETEDSEHLSYVGSADGATLELLDIPEDIPGNRSVSADGEHLVYFDILTDWNFHLFVSDLSGDNVHEVTQANRSWL